MGVYSQYTLSLYQEIRLSLSVMGHIICGERCDVSGPDRPGALICPPASQECGQFAAFGGQVAVYLPRYPSGTRSLPTCYLLAPPATSHVTANTADHLGNK